MSKSLEFLSTMKILNLYKDEMENEKFEDALQKIKQFLFDETTSSGWIVKILSFFIENSNLRNEYNSLIRDLLDRFKYGKISIDHAKKILLQKDRKGFLVPEITLINSAATMYLQGYIDDSIQIFSEILGGPGESIGINIESAKEVAFLLYCLKDEEYSEKIIQVCKEIHKESKEGGKKDDEENRYDYLQRYASTRGLRSKYFSQVFFQPPRENIVKEIFTFANSVFLNPRILVLTSGILFSFAWEIMTEEEKESLCKFLEEKVAQSSDENLKADILDLLARNFPEKDYQSQIRALGQKSGAKTFYDNTQNIHIEGLDEKIFEFLESQKLEDVFEEFSQWVKENGNEDQLASLKRMEKDSSLFMKKYTLQDVCSICWAKIKTSDELKKRLLQEMSDMKDTCFTGHITRLMNVFSGFEDGIISIPWEAQIKANLVKKIEKYLSNLSEEKRDQTVEQFDPESQEKTLVYEMLSELMKELHQEFVGQGYLSPAEFEIYSEKIIDSYIS